MLFRIAIYNTDSFTVMIIDNIGDRFRIRVLDGPLQIDARTFESTELPVAHRDRRPYLK